MPLASCVLVTQILPRGATRTRTPVADVVALRTALLGT